jgi:hypothetical protein
VGVLQIVVPFNAIYYFLGLFLLPVRSFYLTNIITFFIYYICTLRFLDTFCLIGKDCYSLKKYLKTFLRSLNDMSLSVLPEDFGLLTNLTSLELRENLIKVKTPFQIEI